MGSIAGPKSEVSKTQHGHLLIKLVKESLLEEVGYKIGSPQFAEDIFSCHAIFYRVFIVKEEWVIGWSVGSSLFLYFLLLRAL